MSSEEVRIFLAPQRRTGTGRSLLYRSQSHQMAAYSNSSHILAPIPAYCSKFLISTSDDVVQNLISVALHCLALPVAMH